MNTDTRDDLCRHIVDDAPDAIIHAGPDGTILLWNDGASRLFGYTAAEAEGQSLDLIIPERLRARHWEGWDRVMATGETRYGHGDLLAVPGIRKDGSRVSLEFTIALRRDADGRLIGISAILRDISARYEADRELRRRLVALEAQVRAAGLEPAAP